MRYLTYSELIFINGKIQNDPAIMSGSQKIRDIDLLQAAEQRPQSSAFGEDAYPTLREKVAVLAHSITRNHPFKDGNKRTAAVATVFMLTVNGQSVTWDAGEAVTHFLDLAEGRLSWEKFAGWLPFMSVEDSVIIAPDIDADTHIIDRILVEHKWLLDELATR